MKTTTKNILIAVALILAAAFTRVLTFEMQWFNLAPIAAVGLFAGCVIKDKKYAFLYAIMAQLIGDLYIQFLTPWQGFYGIDQAFVYISLLMITALGFIMKQPKAASVLGYSVGAAVLFFLVTNFGVWVAIETGKADLFGYGTGISGLMNTFIAGIPFFKNTLIGTVAGSVLLFGAYHLLQMSFTPKMKNA
jgi:hypothetical protein